MNNSVAAIEVPEIKFSPPLHEQRYLWALEILRRERVTKVLDVGCGEGVFLQHLTHTPPWRAYTSETPAPPVFESADFINALELHGLDIVQDDLSYAADITGPAKHAYGWIRFEQLDISFWEGGLQVPNPAFEGIECIVASEVIEHLPEDVADAFAPVLLGNYAPRLLLLTTPSFDFNERFNAPGEEHWGFKDPTGRTSRIFGDEDHQFEWTVEECVKWCEAAAEEWGYEVVIDGVGRTKDPWGRGRDDDGDTLCATHTAVFRRREGDDWASRRAKKYAEWQSPSTELHKLFVTHRYDAHVGAQSPAPREDIASAVKLTIQDIGSSDVTIFEIWREDSVSTLCGGWLEVLVDVLDNDDAFVLHKDGKNADDWTIELPGVKLQVKNPWQSPTKHNAWAESSESAESSETYDEEDDEEDEYEEYDEHYEEEYDGDDWGETEDSGWAASGSECGSKDESDINTLKAWAEWRPAPGWILDSTWD